ncbi:hypothetical protein PISL3812_06711 [Talaromyces islandicus]|uniref:Uncharacterized protein n=1 Tax=Talaromyces islandicus TaxID=28573 RepID=A0A0U1M2Q9_TALIS|nr:hypothetical protein PISL3812_06711 [Talaromyces islandicus]
MDVSSDIRNISGNWVMDKERSSGVDDVFKLQGIGWITRKAIATATTTLRITQTSDVDSSTTVPTEWMMLEPALTGGLKGVSEKRPLTWAEFEHHDTLFLPVKIRSRYIGGAKISNNRIQPVTELQSYAAGSDAVLFLTGAVVTDLEAQDAKETIEKAFTHDFVQSVTSGWTAEQIWAVETIGSKKFLTRRILVVQGSSIAVLDSCARAPEQLEIAFHECRSQEVRLQNALKVSDPLAVLGFTKTLLFKVETNHSRFIIPLLYADTVVDSIVDTLVSGWSKTLFLP